MNWVKENKFLTGFIIVMVIGLGFLGFEVFSASGAYDDATANYTKQASEYNRLRGLHPFPSKQNLDQYDQQKKEAANVIRAFQVDLATKQFPLTPLTPTAFQDILKATVNDVRQKAGEAQGETKLLPDKFFLGFEVYETKPPTPEASAPLGRELKAIEWVVKQCLENQIAIVGLNRADLPEEKSGQNTGGGRSSGFGGGKPPGGPGGKGGPNGGGADLVQYHRFSITTVSKQGRVLNLLNAISGKDAPQFYVVRQVRIVNSSEKGPAKAKADAGAPAEANKGLTYIVGEESVGLRADIDVVNFNAPAEPETGGAKSSTKGK